LATPLCWLFQFFMFVRFWWLVMGHKKRPSVSGGSFYCALGKGVCLRQPHTIVCPSIASR